jgi:hypothetical protein
VGIQIGVVQSPADERFIIDELLEKYNLYCLPSMIDVSGQVPLRLGNCDVSKQLIFVGMDLPRLGEYLEWTRTRQHANGGYLAGRYFLNTRNTMADRFSETKKVMTFIIKLIKDHYPLKECDSKIPYYVGPKLTNEVRSGLAKIVYPNGEEMGLCPNIK